MLHWMKSTVSSLGWESLATATSVQMIDDRQTHASRGCCFLPLIYSEKNRYCNRCTPLKVELSILYGMLSSFYCYPFLSMIIHMENVNDESIFQIAQQVFWNSSLIECRKQNSSMVKRPWTQIPGLFGSWPRVTQFIGKMGLNVFVSLP